MSSVQRDLYSLKQGEIYFTVSLYRVQLQMNTALNFRK